ncbi:hypothetical protein [Heliomicrobium undosum]|nr:hypothetical protein [Heliomicrobium undosum]
MQRRLLARLVPMGLRGYIMYNLARLGIRWTMRNRRWLQFR